MRYALRVMRLYIGFITYGEATAKYLPYFLPSLKSQTFRDFKILAIDNSEKRENENVGYIKRNYPEIDFSWAGENLGFAKAFNRMIRRAIENGADYFLPLNPDMVFEPDWLEQLVKTMENYNQVGAAQSKILKWDFNLTPACAGRPNPSPRTGEGKTDLIDSLGLAVNKEHRFFDAHQGQIDTSPQPSPYQGEGVEVFGFTGAAVLLNLKALEDVAYKPKSPLAPLYQGGENIEYFDELMFMYKEDCDLSYRLRLAGWKIILAPSAVAYHDREAAAKGETNLKIAWNRLNKSRQVKQWSFLNQWILLLKLKNLPFSARVKLATAWYQFKSLIFVLLFEQYLLPELLKLWKLRAEIKKRREQLKIRIKIKEIEKWVK